jgi:hypothetical protein
LNVGLLVSLERTEAVLNVSWLVKAWGSHFIGNLS